MQNALTEARGEQLEIERIHRMLNYARGERCLTANLLDYFCETIADCGHCSGVGSAELDDFLHGLASTEMNRSSPAASRMREGRRVSDKNNGGTRSACPYHCGRPYCGGHAERAPP